jgi:hypothetical protein
MVIFRGRVIEREREKAARIQKVRYIYIVTYQGDSMTNKNMDSDWNLDLFSMITVIITTS